MVRKLKSKEFDEFYSQVLRNNSVTSSDSLNLFLFNESLYIIRDDYLNISNFNGVILHFKNFKIFDLLYSEKDFEKIRYSANVNFKNDILGPEYFRDSEYMLSFLFTEIIHSFRTQIFNNLIKSIFDFNYDRLRNEITKEYRSILKRYLDFDRQENRQENIILIDKIINQSSYSSRRVGRDDRTSYLFNLKLNVNPLSEGQKITTHLASLFKDFNLFISERDFGYSNSSESNDRRLSLYFSNLINLALEDNNLDELKKIMITSAKDGKKYLEFINEQEDVSRGKINSLYLIIYILHFGIPQFINFHFTELNMIRLISDKPDYYRGQANFLFLGKYYKYYESKINMDLEKLFDITLLQNETVKYFYTNTTDDFFNLKNIVIFFTSSMKSYLHR